jgi:hypothetical protein
MNVPRHPTPCVHVRNCTRTHAHTHTHTNTPTHSLTHPHTTTHTHTHTLTHPHTNTFTHSPAPTWAPSRRASASGTLPCAQAAEILCVCVCVCVCVHARMHVHVFYGEKIICKNMYTYIHLCLVWVWYGDDSGTQACIIYGYQKAAWDWVIKFVSAKEVRATCNAWHNEELRRKI